MDVGAVEDNLALHIYVSKCPCLYIVRAIPFVEQEGTLCKAGLCHSVLTCDLTITSS